MNIYEFDTGPGNIDPWTLKKLKNVIVTDDIAYWVKVGCHTFRCHPNTEGRINLGEDPGEVFMDSLKFWRPGIVKYIHFLSSFIEIGHSQTLDPKSTWEKMAKGESWLTTNGPRRYWVYINSQEPVFSFPEVDYPKFLNDLGALKTQDDLKILIDIWKNK